MFLKRYNVHKGVNQDRRARKRRKVDNSAWEMHRNSRVRTRVFDYNLVMPVLADLNQEMIMLVGIVSILGNIDAIKQVGVCLDKVGNLLDIAGGKEIAK